MKNNLRNKKKKGFTLIELIIVIAIIAIIAVIAIPKFGDVRSNANKNSDVANAKNIQSAVITLIAEDEITKTDFDKTYSLTGNNDVEKKIQGALQSVPKGKASPNKGKDFTVDIDPDGNVTIKIDKDIVYPQPATGTYAE